MSIAKIFLEYAKTFERVFEDDDWSRLEEFFTPDAVYLPGDGKELRGRDNVLTHLKQSLDSFDRRFDLRRVELVSDPVVTAGRVTIQWRAVYEKKGLPDIVLCGTEEATFEGNAISRLEDSLDDGVAETLQTWIGQYGDTLGIST
ncbi:MAG: nuclear transport factor 2 family protein [bacterium]|nr:nuclear transport factor 2 family protein [bacterium]